MTLTLKTAQEWRISTRARGEVLTAAARSEGCRFLVLGAPGGQSVQEMEAWLGDLLGVAAEGTRTDENPRPIPVLLHHALTALLFSHREVWNASPPGSVFSMAFVQIGEEGAFGWVGQGEPRVWIDDQPVQTQWVKVRDHEGKEACALAVKAGARIRVSLDWVPPAAGDPAGVQVEALWGLGDETAGVGAGEAHAGEGEAHAAPFTIVEAMGPWEEPATVVTEAPRDEPSAVAQAMATFDQKALARDADDREPGVPTPSLEVALPDLIPPSPEPPDVTARALGSAEPRAAAAPAREAAAPAARPRPRKRPAWPTERELERTRRRGSRTWMWVAGAAALAVVAWGTGILPGSRGSDGRAPGLALFGLGAARFHVTVESRPPGAWIAADGKDLAQRTPATIELLPGEHQLALSFPDLGSASFTVRGARGDRQALSAPLWGTLAVRDAESPVPIAVELDGDKIGNAPLTVDSLAPGAHELGFSGPGLTPWGQALRVHVGESAEVIAQPMTTPASGVLEVRATFTDGNGTNVLEGAGVWVDGERRGATPLVLELPRGPHSARVEYRGERTPVQVIDLPGGNQRFATFELGVNPDAPTLEVGPLPALVPLGRPTVLAANLDGVTSTDVREMWLNVREPEGTWRRYQMVMLKAPAGVVGVAVFPVALFDSRGNARYYVSASDQTGDEYFTEILTARSAPRPGATR